MLRLRAPTHREGLAWFLQRDAARIVLYFEEIIYGGPQSYRGDGIIMSAIMEPAES